jgi:hypothetical protein
MVKELFQLKEAWCPSFLGEFLGLVLVLAANSRDFHALDFQGRTKMSSADVSASQNPNVGFHDISP